MCIRIAIVICDDNLSVGLSSTFSEKLPFVYELRDCLHLSNVSKIIIFSSPSLTQQDKLDYACPTIRVRVRVELDRDVFAPPAHSVGYVYDLMHLHASHNSSEKIYPVENT